MNLESVPIINQRDKKLFYYLSIFKYLDVKFIHTHIYCHRSKSYCYQRLIQLDRHGYLDTATMYELTSKTEGTVARKVFINGGNAQEFLSFNLAHNSKIHNFHDHYINHQISLANGLVHFDEANLSFEDNNIRVVKMLSEQELSISDKKISIRPDAGFVLEINKSNILYFVEMERSYAKEDDLMRKLVDQYSNISKYITRLEAIEYYNIQSIRLLFISDDDNKMNNIIFKTSKVLNHNVEILFTSLPQIANHMKNDDNILNLDLKSTSGNLNKLYKKIQ
ncbi:hypothetical protein RZE82_07125 [Mollicutes bacterium LVI A0039]|nr:hypothetical protein RZE82_07125 [Mollicutes bacterium LVI A0039]